MKDKYIISKKTGLLLYTSTESVLSEPEKRLMDLANGGTPRNADERQMQKEIKSIEAKGQILIIPSM